jgi:hypothetical protein
VDKIVNPFYIIQPFVEVFNQTALFQTAMKNEFWIHARFNAVTEFLFVQVGVSVSEKGVRHLYLYREVPKRVILLHHAAQVYASDFNPVFGKVASSEFGHKCREGQSNELVTIESWMQVSLIPPRILRTCVSGVMSLFS